MTTLDDDCKKKKKRKRLKSYVSKKVQARLADQREVVHALNLRKQA